MLIRNVRPWGEEASDIVIEQGRIAGIGPHDPAVAAAPGDVDGRGRLVIPSFSDVHVHLDSTRIGLPYRPHTGGSGIWEQVMNDRENWRAEAVPMADRAAGTLRRMIERGTTRVRSYAQVDVDCRLERFEAVMAAKEKHAEQADVQVMTFPQAGILREEGTIELLEESLRQGADVMGGIDPCKLDGDPVRHLDVVFGLAEKYQVDVDIHLHERGTLGVFTTDLIIQRVRALGMQGRVTLSHAYDLGNVDEATTRRLIETFAELDISMATVAPSAPSPLPLVGLVEAGVRVGLGEDGQRDYWGPRGNCDMLDRAWQLAFVNEYNDDAEVELCLAVGTMGGASIMSRDVPRVTGLGDRPGVRVGDAADLLIVEGETPTSATMDRSSDRTVLRAGRVVADQEVLVSTGS